MLTLDMNDTKNLISGKWENSYFFTSSYESDGLLLIITNKFGTVIGKWSGDWVIRPVTRREKKAANDILEFLHFRNLISIWMKCEAV